MEDFSAFHKTIFSTFSILAAAVTTVVPLVAVLLHGYRPAQGPRTSISTTLKSSW